MTFYEQMVPALSALLEKGETLTAPVYGTLLQKRDHIFGYWGITEGALLVSLLQGSSKKKKGDCRLPFSCIRQAAVRKSLVPFQYIIRLDLNDGSMVKLRISKKVYGFPTQGENLDIFLAKIKAYT